MRFALLGTDPDVVRLARAVRADAAHQLVAVFAAGPEAETLRTLAPDCAFRDDWEALLDGQLADAVIAAADRMPDATDADERTERLRELVRAELPLLLVYPACEAIFSYELEWLARDTQTVLWPYVPGTRHPALVQLADMVARGAASEIGRVEQVQIERTLSVRSGGPWFHLARDASLLRGIAGPVREVSAVSVPAEDADPTNVAVSLSGAAPVLIQWSARAAGEETARLVLRGERGQATLAMPPEPRAWTLAVDGRTPPAWPPEADEAAAELRDFVETVAARGGNARWLAVCGDQEVAEAARRSLERGRTVTLQPPDLSDAAAFKGRMVVGGCLVLAIVFAVLYTVGVAEALGFPLGGAGLFRAWPVIVVALLASYLALQWLRPR